MAGVFLCASVVKAEPTCIPIIEFVLTVFRFGAYLPVMTDETKLRPATPDEIERTLAFALRYDGRKRVHTGGEFMARITAERLIEHLERSGYVIMKKPPTEAHRTPGPMS